MIRRALLLVALAQTATMVACQAVPSLSFEDAGVDVEEDASDDAAHDSTASTDAPSESADAPTCATPVCKACEMKCNPVTETCCPKGGDAAVDCVRKGSACP